MNTNNDVTQNEENKENEEPRIIVNDRRHWASDNEESEETTPSKPTYVQKLENELEEQKSAVTEIKAQHKAALEEFEGAKARLRREVDQEVQRGVRKILLSLLDVMDNLDRAVEAADAPEADEESLRGGVRMVREQFLRSLQEVGVERVPTEGEKFDPELHEAVSNVPVADTEQDGTIIGEIKGMYRIRGEILRPGVVAVGKHQG